MHRDILDFNVEDLTLLRVVDTAPHLDHILLEIICIVDIPELVQLGLV